MADINTGSTEEKFIFGQNMEDRVIKPAGEEESALKDGHNNGMANNPDAAPGDDTGQISAPPGGGDKPLLRPSAFSSPSHGQAVSGSSISNNPFAARGAQGSYSDSDDEKREKPIVAPAHFTPVSFGRGGFGFGARPSPNTKMLLRPSALDKQTANFNKENSSSQDFKTTFRLEPAKLQNPFLKTDDGENVESPPKENNKPSEPEQRTEEVEQRLTNTDENSVTSSTLKAPSPIKDTVTQNTTPPRKSGGFIFGQNMENRVFGSADPAPNSGGFVFGEKLEERVTSPTLPPGTVSTPPGPTAASPTPGPTGPTLSPTSQDSNNIDSLATPTEDGKPSSLVESAAAYEARLSRPEFEEVEVRTGEEDESNVFQINVKLFLFDKDNQSWLERGRGQLRLNDRCFYKSRSFQSRLVMRTQGSLRVVMNTKIWSGMLVEMASEKTVRITAVDQDDGVKIYLIMANRSDASHIYSAINSRVQQLKAEECVEDGGDESSSTTTAAGSTQSTLCDSQQTTDDAQHTPANAPNSIQPTASAQPEKRPVETSPTDDRPLKRSKVKSDGHPRVLTEESNDSSTVDPETEASNESCASSPTVKSSSSD